MIEAVLFDYGMVLSGPADPLAWQRMLDISGLDHEKFKAGYWAPRHEYDRGTHTGIEYWQIAGRHAGLELTRTQVEALISADTDLWTQLNPAMIEWAERLQQAGTRTGILSNLGDEMTAGVEARMPWLKGFHTAIFSHRLKLAKPEVEIYRRAAEALETSPENILFVDDRADNCAGALSAGMKAIQYGEHSEFVAELARRGLSALWTAGKLTA